MSERFLFYILRTVTSLAMMTGAYYAKEISSSVNDLNIKMATIIERTDIHTKQIEKLEKRVFDN